jgi:hypothetical protein
VVHPLALYLVVDPDALIPDPREIPDTDDRLASFTSPTVYGLAVIEVALLIGLVQITVLVTVSVAAVDVADVHPGTEATHLYW